MALVRVGDEMTAVLREEPYADEAELEEVLATHDQLLVEDDEPPLALVTRQLHLPGSGIADLVFVDASGLPVVVEVKLGRNPQSKRDVIAQVFDYAAALSDWTVDELDAATDGALEEGLGLLAADEATFKTRWRTVGSNLRAGTVRVVVAVDRMTDELSRVISFINDHSDLDVRLVVIEKYRDPDGGLVFASSTPILSKVPTVGFGARGKTPASAQFKAVLASYGAREDRAAELWGKSRVYRQVRVPGWPADVHYEFRKGRRIGTDLHLEDSTLREVLLPLFEELTEEVKRIFPTARCQFEPDWGRAGWSRIRADHEPGTSPEAVAQAMATLIRATSKPIASALMTAGLTEQD